MVKKVGFVHSPEESRAHGLVITQIFSYHTSSEHKLYLKALERTEFITIKHFSHDTLEN